MVETVSGTYDLVADPSWANEQTEEVRLLCDTSGAPVIINLPEISTIGAAWNAKIFVVDKSQNAKTNNITINAGGTNKIGSDSVEVININGGSIELQVGSGTNWAATKSAEASGVATIVAKGTATILTGTKTITVSSTKVSATCKILATLSTAGATLQAELSSQSITAGDRVNGVSFGISSFANTSADLTVDWMIID
jgi:hypothetical protein